ncbi:MAG: peptidoglycan-binding protein [Acidobacteria bacterium]|nr:peptidoglycan-binding protein [Acidobacteriota bacterium]
MRERRRPHVLIPLLLMALCLPRLMLFPAQLLGRSPEVQRSGSEARKRPPRRASRRRRRRQPAQQRPTPERIREIQQALIREGYLEGEPTGKWDAATAAAMRRLQKDNGRPQTAKPDALSLIALGLGPETAGMGAPRPPTTSEEAASNTPDP